MIFINKVLILLPKTTVKMSLSMASITSMSTASIIIFGILICFCINSQNSGLIEAKRNKRTPIILDEDSWSQMMTGEWMVAFHAPWCPACKKLEPEWRKFAEWSDDLDINVGSADITTNPGLNGRFMVKGLPTIYHVKDGVFRIYSGSREHTALVNFIEEHGWKAIEPQSRFWNPNTLQMTFAAYSFRISMKLRDVHDYLVEDVGLPYYISYSIFALCTVTLGTVLGLIIVFIVDQFCPSRYSSNVQQLETSKSKKSKNKKSDKTNDSDLDDQDDESTTELKSNNPTSERIRKRPKNEN